MLVAFFVYLLLISYQTVKRKAIPKGNYFSIGNKKPANAGLGRCLMGLEKD